MEISPKKIQSLLSHRVIKYGVYRLRKPKNSKKNSFGEKSLKIISLVTFQLGVIISSYALWCIV